MIYTDFLDKYRKFDFEKLKEFGFVLCGRDFVYKTKICDNEFELTVSVLADGCVDVRLIELACEEEFNLVYVKDVQGEFVGKVRAEFEKVLENIRENCTVYSVFTSDYAYKIIDYINQKYSAQPEYLWEKFPNNAVFRKKDNSKTGGKWYGAILTAKRKSVGLEGEGEIEVIDLKASPDEIAKIVDNKRYFPAYHMNKKHWITICLDGSVEFDEIKKRIDDSYNLL